MENGEASRDRRTRPLSIKRNMAWNSAGSFCNLFCQWLVTVLVLRLSTGYDAAGVYSYAMSVYLVFAPVVDYRLYVYQISDLHGEHTLGEYLGLRLVTGGIGIALLTVYSLVTSDPSLLPPILCYALYKVTASLLDGVHAFEQVNRRMDYIGVSYALQGLVTLVVFAGVFAATQNLALALFCVFLGVCAVGVFYDLPHARYFTEFSVGIPWRRAWAMLVRCAPAVLAFVTISGATSIPRQYLMAAMGEAALGAYGTMAAPMAIVQTGAAYIYNPLLGYFTEAYERCDAGRFWHLMGLVAAGIVAIGAVCVVGVELLGEFLYTLVYGARVADYVYLLPPIVAGSLSIAFLSFMDSLSAAVRTFRTNLAGGTIALAVSLAAMAPMVAAFQLNGVTYTVILACLCGGGFNMLALRRSMARRFAQGASDGPEGRD